MRHTRALLAAVALTMCLVSPMVWAQADARKAFEDGKAAWTAGEFTRARDLFLAASRTDTRNPEVFLWLGKAHYQLGELTEAVAAWRRTLALAPDEPYAAAMIAALSGEMRDVDMRIRLIETMLREKLHDAALKQCTDLLRETAPTDAQRARAMLLLARAQLASCRPADALETVNRLVVRYPALADEAETTLVRAEARLAQGGDGVAEAVELFRKVVAGHPNTPSAAAARYHLLRIDLAERATTARVKALEDWIAANPAHDQLDDARRLLVTSLLKLTELSGPPRKDAPLSVTDLAALRTALELLKQTANVTETAKLTKQLARHLEWRYAAAGSHQAAIDGARQLLSVPLPFACRLQMLQHLRGFQALAADAYLDGLAKSGAPVPPGALPQTVADVLATIQTIRTEFPEETSAWLDQALLVQSLGKLSVQTPWPAQPTALKPPMQWTIDVALPVIVANANDQAVPRALAVVREIVQSCRALGEATGFELALSVNTRLVAAVPKTRPEWRQVTGTQLELLDALARAVFDENVRAGRDDLNAKVSEPQQRYLAVLATLQREDPAEAPGLLKPLNTHLKGWIARGHYETAQTMLETLAKELPLKERREAELEVAKLWVCKVMEADARRKAAGLEVPRELPPDAARAAERLYALQRDLDETDPFLTAVRGELMRLRNHYVMLEYDDVAEKALTTKVAPAIEVADTWAEFEVIGVRHGRAAREFERSLAAYGAREKITLTPALAEAVASYRKFITDHPTNRRVPAAANGVFGVAQLLEKHKGHAAAAAVYGDFARFASTVRLLSESAPGTPSLARTAAWQQALALEAHARDVLAKTRAVEGPDAKPPAKLSDEFAAAIETWKTFLATDPTGPLAAEALKHAELIGLDYVRLDAWDVAEAVYADILASLKTLEAPERLEFARGLCRLGPAMPDHARTGLASLLGRPSPKRPDPDKTPAVIVSDDEIARQQKAIDAAYAVFIDLMRKYPNTAQATQARAEVLTMIAHWRTLGRGELAAALGTRYLADRPTDVGLPALRLAVARDLLSWAARPVPGDGTPQERLAEVTTRFEKARAELVRFAADFPEERTLVQQAQWESAGSWLVQARAVAAFSPTLARGQFVRAAREILRVGELHGDHPNVAQVPQMLWNIAAELQGRGDFAEAVTVWNALVLHYPTHALAQQASLRVAQTCEQNLSQPLKAAELYQEIWFARGGADGNLPAAIFNIGAQLREKKRWIEALHVLESFVDSFPRDPKAGQALTMIGQIHQANEAWTDAIEAYRRVIDEYPNGNWVHDAKWSIAECTLNLSRWREAANAYNVYLAAYPTGHNSAEAKRRIDVLKDLQRYQTVADEKGQRKAFDAQYQIATIVLEKLSNPVKAIIEYRKVAAKWDESHLADDALYAVGRTYLSIGETAKAREALLLLASRYTTSPLADDALHMVGQTYEQEAQQLAGMDLENQLKRNEEIAQRHAYSYAQEARRQMRADLKDTVTKLKEAGRPEAAALAEAQGAANTAAFDRANVYLAAGKARQEAEHMTAAELADRQDKINASLRRALEAYAKASQVAGADKAGDALLRMAAIYDQKLKDAPAAMKTWLEIVRQFSGTAVAEDASWKIAQYYEREREYQKAIDAYEAFLRNYRRSPRAGDAQFAVAENFEHLGKWVNAMDAYTNYINNFPQGPLVEKAREQINWIKTYRL